LHFFVAAIWREFWESGPDGKPPIRAQIKYKLMIKYKVDSWYLADGTKHARNNRVNVWHKRYAALSPRLVSDTTAHNRQQSSPSR